LLQGASYVRIEGFELTAFSEAGFFSNDMAHHLELSRNHLHHIGQVYSCSDYGKAAIFAGNGTSHTTIDSNLIQDVGRLHQDCPYPDGGADTDLAYIDDHGVYLYGNNNTVVNNVFYNCNSGWELQIAGGSAPTDGPGWLVTNNTFGPSDDPRTNGEVVIFTESGGHPPSEVTIQNNISYNPTGRSFINNVYYAGDATCLVQNNLVLGGEL
jgi:hypothetical protein